MAIRKIVKKGEELLRKKSKPVKDFDEDLWQLLDDMYETMHANDGMGIDTHAGGRDSQFASTRLFTVSRMWGWIDLGTICCHSHGFLFLL